MKTKHFIVTVIFLLSSSCIAFADRVLERAEILQIFQQLTSQPRKTWIPAGTIKATHEEYKAPKITDPNKINSRITEKIAEYQNNPQKRELTGDLQKMELDAIPFNVRHELSNEYLMSSSVIVRFDGNRFYWEINAASRTDSVKPGKNLAGNFMTKQFDMDWNGRRIFAWDGEKYTTYFLPGNHATVDTTGRTPHVVNGPLTAGIVPWGYGYYSYDNLVSLSSAATEKQVDSQTQVYLTLSNADGSQMLFVMDPRKDYAVLTCSISGGNFVASKQYSDYRSVSGRWDPATILLEQYEAESNRLLVRDLWKITGIDANVPASYDFDVNYETDALVEHFAFSGGTPETYRYSQTANTELLLAERLVYKAAEKTLPQNCATASLKHVASQLGKDVTDQQLAELVDKLNGRTSLYAMKQFVQGLGLYCRAIKTDIETLKSLNGCKAVLHIPGKEHFIVLDSIDNKYVWTIDLGNNKFYYHTDINFFGMDWTEGTALLVSNSPIAGEFDEIDDGKLQTIIGAAGYSCTRLLQEYNVIFCSQVGGLCGGLYEEYYERWGCASATSGSCSSYILIRYKTSPCIEDLYYPDMCNVTGEWTCYNMRACA